MPWVIIFLREVEDWFEQLDPETANLVGGALDLLEERGPNLGRPLADRIHGPKLSNLKELRPGSLGGSELRVLFAFDRARNAVLLVAGDKSSSWSRWYDENIPLAEERFKKWLAGDYGSKDDQDR